MMNVNELNEKQKMVVDMAIIKGGEKSADKVYGAFGIANPEKSKDRAFKAHIMGVAMNLKALPQKFSFLEDDKKVQMHINIMKSGRRRAYEILKTMVK